eukprot:2820075-Amphidinium_carterae.1
MPNLITQQTLTHRYLTNAIKQWDDSVDSQTKSLATFLFRDGRWGVAYGPHTSFASVGEPD